MKESIHQEDMTILNTQAPNNRVSKYMMHILTEVKGKINSSIIIIEDFNTSL